MNAGSEFQAMTASQQGDIAGSVEEAAARALSDGRDADAAALLTAANALANP